MKGIRGFSCWLLIGFFVVSCSSASHEKPKPQVVYVEIAGMKFQPQEVRVHAGDKLVFRNNDMVAHDITEEGSKLWSSGPLASGSTWSKTVTESADYYCTIHPVMKGKIVVQ